MAGPVEHESEELFRLDLDLTHARRAYRDARESAEKVAPNLPPDSVEATQARQEVLQARERYNQALKAFLAFVNGPQPSE